MLSTPGRARGARCEAARLRRGSGLALHRRLRRYLRQPQRELLAAIATTVMNLTLVGESLCDPLHPRGRAAGDRLQDGTGDTVSETGNKAPPLALQRTSGGTSGETLALEGIIGVQGQPLSRLAITPWRAHIPSGPEELTESAGDIRFGEAREVELKGLAGRRRVFEVGW